MNISPRRLDAEAPGFERELAALIAFESAQNPAVEAAVAAILADVRIRGDAALLEYTAKFDRFAAASASALEIPASEIRLVYRKDRASEALIERLAEALKRPAR